MAAVTVRTHKGAQYAELYSTSNVKRIVVEFGDKKLMFSGGQLSVDLISESYKYGTEFQIKYWTREDPQELPRTADHNGYARVGFYLSPEEGKRLVRALTE